MTTAQYFYMHTQWKSGLTFVDGHNVCDAIARVQHDACRSAGGVKRQHGLDRHVKRRHVKRLKHDLKRW